ncbi:MAG: glycoside hydrolase family 19 protein, partial [Bacteroidota bacterium]
KIDDTGKAIVKVKLRKKSDEDYKKQQEALKDDKQARLFLKVTCQGDDRKHKIAFINHLKLMLGGKCYCNKEIDLELINQILPADVKEKGLFYKSRYSQISGLSIDEFLTSLNKSMEDFEIKTCLQKAHFLSQILLECDNLRTTEEYGYNNPPSYWSNYKGGSKYHGRGLIQLTHDYNYKEFGNSIGVNLVQKPDQLASNIDYVTKSACWYWRKGSAWGDLNKYADKDDIHYITIGVNGGFNHYCDRKNNLIKLVDFMKIDDLCSNTSSLEKDVGTYSFETSSLSQSKVGTKFWNSAKYNKYKKCEK